MRGMLPLVVLAHHLIFTTYGFWLPNDPRGSWSDFVRNWELFWYGAATKVDTHRSLARREHDRGLRKVQKSALRYEPVHFTGKQALSVARGISLAVAESNYVVFACSILPEHVHMVVQAHRDRGEQMIGHFKARATQQLIDNGLHPFVVFPRADGRVPSVWARRGWKVFLNTVDDIFRAAQYADDNPLKEGKNRQQWSFVTPYASRFDDIDPDALLV